MGHTLRNDMGAPPVRSRPPTNHPVGWPGWKRGVVVAGTEEDTGTEGEEGMKVIIWHNPRCSKSRQTLQLLQERGIDPEIVRYLETPPSADEIREVLKLLGFSSARELMRKKEKEYRELNLADEARSEDELIRAMVEHPRLIERPVVIVEDEKGRRAALGRPPENVLALFG